MFRLSRCTEGTDNNHPAPPGGISAPSTPRWTRPESDSRSPRVTRSRLVSVLIVAVVVVAAILAAVTAKPAHSLPGFRTTCDGSGCHAGTPAGTVTAIPSTTTPAAGATYNVAITIGLTSSGNTGYRITYPNTTTPDGGCAGRCQRKHFTDAGHDGPQRARHLHLHGLGREGRAERRPGRQRTPSPCPTPPRRRPCSARSRRSAASPAAASRSPAPTSAPPAPSASAAPPPP